MSYQFNIKIPIRKSFKKMIERTTSTDPFVITMSGCYYSNLLYSSLLKKYIQIDVRRKDIFNDTLDIVIPEIYAKENRIYYDTQTLIFIDKTLKSLFDDKYLTYMADNCKEKGDIINFTEQFKFNYNLTEEDIATDTLVKSFQRARKAKIVKVERNFRRKKKNQVPVVKFIPPISKQIDQLGLFE